MAPGFPIWQPGKWGRDNVGINAKSGYAQVSANHQNPDLQMDAVNTEGG